MMQPELIADYQCVVGEGPLWHPIEQRLYWTDIQTGRMFRYDPATGQHEQFYQGDPVGGFTFQADGSLLLFGSHGSIRTWHAGRIIVHIAEIPEERPAKFNDVCADPEGRVFCGTVDFVAGSGRFYRLNRDGSLERLLEGSECSNGIGFSPALRTMYYTDSYKHTIYAFDYAQRTGALSNQRILIQTPPEQGVPDGMTVDVEGYLWSAFWDGSCVVRYDPEGREVQRLTFPAKQVSSVQFGGADYHDLYVTTAGGQDKANQGPGAGALYRVRGAGQGRPEFLSRIWL